MIPNTPPNPQQEQFFAAIAEVVLKRLVDPNDARLQGLIENAIKGSPHGKLLEDAQQARAGITAITTQITQEVGAIHREAREAARKALSDVSQERAQLVSEVQAATLAVENEKTATIEAMNKLRNDLSEAVKNEFAAVTKYRDNLRKQVKSHWAIFSISVALLVALLGLLLTKAADLSTLYWSFQTSNSFGDSASSNGVAAFAISVAAAGLLLAWIVGILSLLTRSSLHLARDGQHRLAAADAYFEMRSTGQLEKSSAAEMFKQVLSPPQSGLLTGAEPHPLIKALTARASKAEESSK